MEYNINILMNLGLENLTMYQMAKILIPQCEFQVKKHDKHFTDYLISTNDTQKIYKTMIPRFHYVTKEEENDIFSNTWSKEKKYDMPQMPYGFYFPDYIFFEIKRFMPEIVDEIIDEKIKKHFYDKDKLIIYKQALYRSVFCILHEYGHYMGYKRLHSDKVAYAKFVYASKEEFRNNNDELNNKKNLSEEASYKRRLIYRNSPDEKEQILMRWII